MPDLRVADLLSDPVLDTWLVAGARGEERLVTWAHASETSSPERWLGPGELLMTIGLSLPRDGDGQRALVARLDDAGVVGMTIGEDGLAPPLTDALLAEADARGFPIMRTGPTTPFIVIARTVAAANAETQARGITLLSRMYQLVGTQDPLARRSGHAMSELVGQRITVVDERTGCAVIGDLADSRTESASAGTVGRRSHPLRTFRPTRLLLDAGRPLESMTLMHLLQVLSVDANAILQDAVRRVEQGEAVLRTLFAGGRDATVPPGWLPPAVPFQLVAFSPELQEHLPLALALEGIPPLSESVGEHSVLVVAQPDLDRVREVFARAGACGGVSAPHRDPGDLRGAVSEAVSEYALAAAADGRPGWRLYDGWPVSLLSRSRTERRDIIGEVLGPLAGADEKAVRLRETLFALLDNELNQKLTAAQLGLHPQTLVYRMRRVQALTGRSIRTPKGISELWIARNAWDEVSPHP